MGRNLEMTKTALKIYHLVSPNEPPSYLHGETYSSQLSFLRQTLKSGTEERLQALQRVGKVESIPGQVKSLKPHIGHHDVYSLSIQVGAFELLQRFLHDLYAGAEMVMISDAT